MARARPVISGQAAQPVSLVKSTSRTGLLRRLGEVLMISSERSDIITGTSILGTTAVCHPHPLDSTIFYILCDPKTRFPIKHSGMTAFLTFFVIPEWPYRGYGVRNARE